MKAQFFIISSVIIIYIITLSFQYLTSFSDIKVSGIEEQQDFSYIGKIKDSFVQAFKISNYTNNGDLSIIVQDMNFNKNFSNQELLKRGISFDSKFIFFSNGFETGDTSEWTSVFGTPSIDSGTKYDGNYSLYSNGLEGVSKKLDGINEVYTRVYVNFKTLPSSNTHYFLGFYDHGNQILMLGLQNNGNSYNLVINSIVGQFYSVPIDIYNNEWHYYDVYWYGNVSDPSSKTFKVWYDGNLETNQTITGFSGGRSIDEYRFGGVSASGGTPDLFVDCVAIGSDYIGGDCYPDAEPYFVFSLKTKEMYTKTGFSYYNIPSYLIDTLPPTYSNPQTSNAIAGQPSNFTLDWSDNFGLSGYIFSTNNSGRWQNSSWISFGGVTSMKAWNVTTLNSTVGTVVGWKYYANDTSNNWATSITYTLMTATYPRYWLNFVNNTVAGKPILFSLNWTDSSGLSGYIFSTNNSGTWINASFVNFSGITNTSWNVTTANSTVGTNVSWCVYANNTINNWNSTSCINPFSFTISSGISDNVLNLNFNEANGTIAHDSSIYHNDGTFYGETFNDGTIYGAIRVSGNYGNALSFDGTSDYVKVPLSNDVDFGNQDFAITLWMEGGYQAHIGYLFSKNYASNEAYYGCSMPGSGDPGMGRIRCYMNDTASVHQELETVLVYNDSAWHHVAFVRNRTSDRILIYVDGIERANAIDMVGSLSNMTADSVNNFFIGERADLAVRYFNGTIDEVRVWNRSLNNQEIIDDMGSSRPLGRTNAAWSFEEPSAATYVNDTHIWVNGTSGSALSFDGIGDYVNVLDSNSLNITNEMTVAAWVYPLANQSTGGSNQIVQRLSYGTSQGFFLREGSSQTHIPDFYVGNGTNSTGNCGSNCWMYATASKISTDAWHYIVGTVKANDKIRIYVDGNLKAENNFIGNINQSTGGIKIGYESSTKAFNGTIDEVRIWNRSLSAPEIWDCYQTGC